MGGKRERQREREGREKISVCFRASVRERARTHTQTLTRAHVRTHTQTHILCTHTLGLKNEIKRTEKKERKSSTTINTPYQPPRMVVRKDCIIPYDHRFNFKQDRSFKT